MNNLKNLRIGKGVSQQAVAEYLGMSRQAYSNYENGNREPDFETMLKIGEYFSCSVDYILRGPSEARIVDSWHDDMWEDWNGAKNDDDRRNILKLNGVPPQLLSQYFQLFEQKQNPASVSADGKLYPAGYDRLTPENRKIVDRLIADLANNQSAD